MKITLDITSEQAREIIRSLQDQLAQQEVSLQGQNPAEVLAMPPMDLEIESPNKGLRTRAYQLLERAQTGKPESWQDEELAKPIKTLEAFCLLDKRRFRVFGYPNGKTGKLIQAALARKGLRLFMTRSDIQAYKEGIFKLTPRERATI
jgi:hypothetical protein